MISSRGIDANPDKIQVVLEMKLPQNIKEVKWLTGYIAALGCVMSRFANKYQPFFLMLRRCTNFVWGKEAGDAFQALKAYLAHMPKMASPSVARPYCCT